MEYASPLNLKKVMKHVYLSYFCCQVYLELQQQHVFHFVLIQDLCDSTHHFCSITASHAVAREIHLKLQSRFSPLHTRVCVNIVICLPEHKEQ
jgi:hypothetical protein